MPTSSSTRTAASDALLPAAFQAASLESDAMSGISKAEHALHLALIRTLEPARPVDPGAVGGQSGKTAPAAEPVAPAPTFDLDAEVRQRVERIRRDAPDRRARVLRALLEACVARAFGAAAPSDPGFLHVIDQAHDAMQSDPDMAAAMDRLAAQFDDPSGRGPA